MCWRLTRFASAHWKSGVRPSQDHVDEMILYMENCGISSESAKAYAEIVSPLGSCEYQAWHPAQRVRCLTVARFGNAVRGRFTKCKLSEPRGCGCAEERCANITPTCGQIGRLTPPRFNSRAKLSHTQAEIEAPKKNDTREQADLKRARRELTNLLDGFQIPDEAVKQ